MYSYLNQESSKEENDIIDSIISQINQKQIPNSYPEHMFKNINKWSLRDKFIKQMGFSLISLDWIIPLSKWIGSRKCLEVMSGTGSLSFALKQQGVDIKATDDFSWKSEHSWNIDNNYWTDIENIDAIDAVKKYGKDINVIIMSWPYMDDNAYKVLQAMREVNSFCKMIFIGEGYGGCTASDEFFDIIVEIEDETFSEAIKEYKQWWGIHDYPQLVK